MFNFFGFAGSLFTIKQGGNKNNSSPSSKENSVTAITAYVKILIPCDPQEYKTAFHVEFHCIKCRSVFPINDNNFTYKKIFFNTYFGKLFFKTYILISLPIF